MSKDYVKRLRPKITTVERLKEDEAQSRLIRNDVVQNSKLIKSSAGDCSVVKQYHAGYVVR